MQITKPFYFSEKIESLNRSIRKRIKTRASFPNDEAALKLIYIAIQDASKKWTMPIRDWGAALNRFAIVFGERVTKHLHS